MSIQEIKKQFPKSLEEVRAWGNELFVKQYTSLLQNVPEEMKAGIEKADIPKMTDEALEGFIAFYPRRLYDFFDSRGLEIYIYAGFKYDINGEEEDEEYLDRTRCEAAAFQKAFKLLEEEL